MKDLKVLAVGDLHGKSSWQAIDIEQYDQIVFLGDYVDSLHHSDQEILENFKGVINLKKSKPKKIILLLGNHDIQYLHYPKYRCSGFRDIMQLPLTELYTKNHHLFHVSYQISNYLFSHAGVSQPWYDKFTSFFENTPVKEKFFDFDCLSETLNAVEQTRYREILHLIGVKRGGIDEFGGLTWADKEELWNHPLEGYHQVVGHTPVPYIETITYNDKTSVTFIDVLGSQEAYYEIEVPFNKK